jgi:hypothetical protein
MGREQLISEMVGYLQQYRMERKLRLFLVACARSLWDQLDREDIKGAVTVAEQYADGEACASDMDVQHHAIMRFGTQNRPADQRRWREDHYAAFAVVRAATAVSKDVDGLAQEAGALHYHDDAFQKQKLTYLGDIVGAPFRPTSLGRSRRSPTVISLAQAAYDDRRLPSGLFDNQRLAVLGDALEEAGCERDDILGHLRCGCDHVRGCWAVDLVLGKS